MPALTAMLLAGAGLLSPAAGQESGTGDIAAQVSIVRSIDASHGDEAPAAGIAPLRRVHNFNRPHTPVAVTANEHVAQAPRQASTAGGIAILAPQVLADIAAQRAMAQQEATASVSIGKRTTQEVSQRPAQAGTQQGAAMLLHTGSTSPAATEEKAGGSAGSTMAASAEPSEAASSGKADALAPVVPAAQTDIQAQEELQAEKAAITPGPPMNPAQAQEVNAPLYLEATINGNPTNLIAEFVRLPGGGFAARAKELDDLGIRVPGNVSDDELVKLADIGARAAYDESAQKIDIILPVTKLKRNVHDLAGGGRGPVEVTPGGIGMVLNYSVNAAARARNTFTENTFEGVSAQLEGWIYSPYGALFTSGLVRKQEAGQPEAIRLDSSWRFVDVERAVEYQIGDLIASGPGWARSVRLGGAQVRRSFRLKPDAITTPLPSLSGTAAVPSVIDVYVNNLKVHSGEVRPGPFEITNIPALSQGGVARLVMRDATGREKVIEQSFYVSPKLLREGLFEFSLAAGVPRNNYGIKSFDYDWRYPGVAGSARYGISDSITVQGHAEAARDLILAGAGVNFTLLDRMLLSASGAVSHGRRGTGFLTHFTAETSLMGLHVAASSLRTWGDYADLAALAAARASLTADNAVLAGASVPRAVESLNVGYAWSELGASLSAALVHVQPREGSRTLNLNISYSQNLWGGASLYATALFNLKDARHPGFFAGLTVPLGDDGSSLNASGNHDRKGGTRASLSYSKPLKEKDGAVGWRARVTYGDLKSLEGSLAWRTPWMTVRGTAMQLDKATLGRVSVDGALVLADGALFAANRVHDSFAIVNAGAAGVKVRYENREVGTTRGDGRLLIPSLRSLQRNKISIDPETMPVDAVVEDDKTYVVPNVRGGVVVRFNTRRTTHAALVVLHNAEGKPIAPGAEVRLEGVEEVFTVGYDGETYLDGLQRRNTVVVDSGDGNVCRASFDFTPGKEVQPRIGPVKCLP